MSERFVDIGQQQFSRTLPFGAHMTGAEHARFRVWAPSANRVELLLDQSHAANRQSDDAGGVSVFEMEAEHDGWYDLTTPCSTGAQYRYRMHRGTDAPVDVPDPASRFQPDDVHGASEVIAPQSYRWQHPKWAGRPWEETVLYELHVGAFGGYQGVMNALPELKALGITAIELMPLNDFPGERNWGYDGVLPFAPDSSYGRPEDLKALIDAAHGLQMMVFLDVVYNHFGPDGNYLHVYAESFFKADSHTPWGPAIDFDRSEVREYFFENALYWLLEFRFDGLRLDAVHAIDNDGWLRELSERVHASVEPWRRVHLVLENERNTSSLLVQHFNAQWSDDAHNTLHVLLTGETESYYTAFADNPLHKLARVLGEGFVYQGEPSPIHDGAPRGEPSGSLPPSAFVFFLQNHDQTGNRAFGERLRSLTDDDRLRAATALMLLSPQIPMLFMGEETGTEQPFYFFTAYKDQLADAVREGRRKEFAKFAAFNDPARREKIPDPNAVSTFMDSKPFGAVYGTGNGSATESQADIDAWRTFYRDALRVRHQHVIPGLHGGARALGACVVDGAVIARWRLSNGQRLTVAINFDDREAQVADWPDALAAANDDAARSGAGFKASNRALEGRSNPDLKVHLQDDLAIFETQPDTARLFVEGRLPPCSFVAMLGDPNGALLPSSGHDDAPGARS